MTTNDRVNIRAGEEIREQAGDVEAAIARVYRQIADAGSSQERRFMRLVLNQLTALAHHQATDPDCTCNDCIASHVGDGR